MTRLRNIYRIASISGVSEVYRVSTGCNHCVPPSCPKDGDDDDLLDGGALEATENNGVASLADLTSGLSLADLPPSGDLIGDLDGFPQAPAAPPEAPAGGGSDKLTRTMGNFEEINLLGDF